MIRMRPSASTVKAVVLLLFVGGGLAYGVRAPAGAEARSRGAHAGKSVSFRPRLPEGIPYSLWRKFVPADNQLTEEKVALGEALFFDRRLSADGSLSCATCHDPASAFADHHALAVGVGGRTGTRNAPTLLNSMFAVSQFWDGRAQTLEAQVRHPLLGRDEMGMESDGAVVARVAEDPAYRREFAEVFGDAGISVDTIAKAVASYERTRLSGDSPFDRFNAGDREALTEAQRRGWKLFQTKARCAECHTFNRSSPFFTDFGFHNTGVATRGEDLDLLARQFKRDPDDASAPRPPARDCAGLGRYLVTGRAEHIGAFKTPTLRDVELTAPYMHDGSEKTLLDVVRFYNRGGLPNAHRDERVRPLNLTEAEMSDLVEFMRALTSDDVLLQAQRAKPQARGPAASSPVH
jgi:cytochrome c peroxidase